MSKRPFRMRLEDRGMPRRQWVSYLFNGRKYTQLFIFAPGQTLSSALRDLGRFVRVSYNAQ